MAPKRIHFPMTTASQRRLLFAAWEATGDVALACRTAHMGRATFYYWKPRFTAGGYAALESFASRAPRRTRCLAPAIAQQVIALHHDHPAWGKDRIADELTKANDWVPLISPNTVRRMNVRCGCSRCKPKRLRDLRASCFPAQCGTPTAPTSTASFNKISVQTR